MNLKQPEASVPYKRGRYVSTLSVISERELLTGRCGGGLLRNVMGLRKCVMLTLLEKLNINYNEIKFS